MDSVRIEFSDQFVVTIQSDSKVIGKWTRAQDRKQIPRQVNEKLDESKLLNEFRLSIARLRAGALAGQETAIRELGRKMYEAIFTGDVKALFETALEHVTAKNQANHRLCLIIEVDQETQAQSTKVAEWPFEYLYSQETNYLSTHNNIVLYRRINPKGNPRSEEDATPPLRVLVVVSLPQECGGAVPVTVLKVLGKLATSTQTVEPLLDVKVLGLPPDSEAITGVDFLNYQPATWSNITSIADLAGKNLAGKPWYPHVLHFIGHGEVESSSLGLIAEQGGQAPYWCDSGMIMHLFEDGEDYQKPQLVVLQACEGAQKDTGLAFLALVARLINLDIRAVVVTQTGFADEYASYFADGFYNALMRSESLDEAVQYGRRSIAAKDHYTDHHFGAPVLFTYDPVGIIVSYSGSSGSLPRESKPDGRKTGPITNEIQRTIYPSKVSIFLEKAIKDLDQDPLNLSGVGQHIEDAVSYCRGSFSSIKHYLEPSDINEFLKMNDPGDIENLKSRLGNALMKAREIDESRISGSESYTKKQENVPAAISRNPSQELPPQGRRPEDVRSNKTF